MNLYFFQCGDRRQILTFKVNARTERVNLYSAGSDFIRQNMMSVEAILTSEVDPRTVRVQIVASELKDPI